MANEKHLELARQGREVWNRWRAANPGERADFSDADFANPENSTISFAGFEFGDHAIFVGATFEHLSEQMTDCLEDLNYRDLAIEAEELIDVLDGEKLTPGGGAVFIGATFGGNADFRGACFGDHARFDGVKFGNNANFSGVRFGDRTILSRTRFGHNCRFDGIIFGHYADFSFSEFGRYARFCGAVFTFDVEFKYAAFKGFVRFTGATFFYHADFRGAEFSGLALFDGGDLGYVRDTLAAALSRLPDIESKRVFDCWNTTNKHPNRIARMDFSQTKFNDRSNFSGRSIKGIANFAGASFAQPPNLYDLENVDRLDLTGTKFAFGDRGHRNWTTDTSIAANLRRLRKLTADIHATDAQRDLFILERLAERGILWRGLKSKENLEYTSGLVQAAGHCLLMFLYKWSSDYGRSVGAPLAWLLSLNLGFHLAYGAIFSVSTWNTALWKFTFSTLLPFGALAREARTEALASLGGLHWGVVAVSIVQGVANVILLFLIGLALRNFFKTK